MTSSNSDLRSCFMTKTLFGCLLLTVVALHLNVLAQPELDPTFAGIGKTTVIFGATASADDMVILPDNRIVLVSSCSHIVVGFKPFCAVRVDENGVGDGTFQSQDGVGAAFANVGSDVTGVTIQNDGKIVAAGYAGGSNENIVIVRWNSNGTNDLTFGGGAGWVITDLGANERAEKVMMQPDGKILIVGRTGTSLFVARYLTGGTLDPMFGVGGVAKVVIKGIDTSGLSIALQADGRILAGGSTASAHLVARFTPDGLPDNSWDSDGIMTIGSANTFEDNGLRSIALQTDGRVLALSHDNVLYRFNTDGSPDMSFDGDGARQALDLTAVEPHDVMISPGGLITVVGEWRFTPLNFLTARYLSSGSPDTTYSGDGFLQIDVSGNDGAWAAAADSLGRILVAGRSSSCCINSPFELPVFSVARIVAPAAPVGISGRVTAADGRPVSRATVTVSGGGGVRTAITNPFGFYSFPILQVGQVYAVAVNAKRYEFESRNVFVGDQVANFDFVEQAPGTIVSK